MLKMKKFFLLAMLASAFALITSCGGGAGGGPESSVNQLYADGFEFDYKMSMNGQEMSTGTFGGKGNTIWNEMSMGGMMSMGGTMSMKQVIKLSSDGKKQLYIHT